MEVDGYSLSTRVELGITFDELDQNGMTPSGLGAVGAGAGAGMKLWASTD